MPSGAQLPRPSTSGPAGPPSRLLYLCEPGRSAADFVTLLAAAPWLARAPRGDGHPVLVLPGLLATDASTLPLRRYLRYLGYPVHGWKLGRNRGPTPAVVAGLPSAVERLAQQHSQPITIIGWSLGGIYARRLTRATPDLIRQVITLGSPFAMTDSNQSHAIGTLNRHAHGHVDDEQHLLRPRPTSGPIPVPSTSIYSKSDGIVAWQACREDPGPQRESIAVPCSHLGFGHNPAVLWLVADRLAQQSGHWHPFTAPRALRALYRADPTKTVPT